MESIFAPISRASGDERVSILKPGTEWKKYQIIMNKKKLILPLLMLAFAVCASAGPVIDFVSSRIVRVRWSPDGNRIGNNTGACVYKPEDVKVDIQDEGGYVSYSSPELIVTVERPRKPFRLLTATAEKCF